MKGQVWQIATVALWTNLIVAAPWAQATEDSDWPRFPSAGASYQDAKKDLVAQGMKIASDKPAAPRRDFPEVDCGSSSDTCRALFVFTTKDGWSRYVIVTLDKADLHLVAAAFAKPVDALPSIPPKIAADIPKLQGDYPSIRKALLQAAFKPIDLPPDPAAASLHDGQPEATCFVDGAGCLAYWKSKDGRVLIVVTRGETLSEGSLLYAYWAKPSDLQDLQRMQKRRKHDG